MVKYKGKAIHPYESFYWNTTQEFFWGELGGGIARCVKCDDSLATLVMEEIKVQQVVNIVDDTNKGFKNQQRGRVYSVDGLSPCLNCCEGGGLEPKIMEPMCSIHPLSHKLEFNPETSIPTEPTCRIRKLTPREAFRLMGVDDKDIDTIQATKISNSAQYKLAGNSIVVDVLYHIFRKAFVETNNEQQQLTLF